MEQYIKLFSNPVSGIACEVDAYNRDHRVKYHCQNIRYSKSMILKALYFWEKQYDRYLELLKKAQFNPLFDSFDKNKENEILKSIILVHNLPDSFLFSHRYIQPGHFKDYSDDTPCALIKKKYPIIEKDRPLWIQKGKRDIFFGIHLTYLGIHFTVFPNEHPYIPRQKISRVGMTEKGNVFVIHKNGAQRK